MLSDQKKAYLVKVSKEATEEVIEFLVDNFGPWLKQDFEGRKQEAIAILEFLQDLEIKSNPDNDFLCRREEVGKAIDILLKKVEQGSIITDFDQEEKAVNLDPEVLRSGTNNLSKASQNSQKLLDEKFGEFADNLRSQPARVIQLPNEV